MDRETDENKRKGYIPSRWRKSSITQNHSECDLVQRRKKYICLNLMQSARYSIVSNGHNAQLYGTNRDMGGKKTISITIVYNEADFGQFGNERRG